MSSPRKETWTINMIGGTAGGIAASVATCPLEVLKTRLQSSAFKQTYTTIPSALQTIIQQEGIKGLFRGLLGNVAGLVPGKALNIVIYAESKKYIEPYFEQDSVLVPMCSAISSSFFTATTLNPLWVIKTRLQLQKDEVAFLKLSKSNSNHALSGQQSYQGYLHAMRTIYQEEGLRGYTRGLTASYFGIIEWMIYFTLYEEMKQRCRDSGVAFSGSTVLVASSVAKLFAAGITYPYEVIRTRAREERAMKNSQLVYRGFMQSLVHIYKHEGVGALYSGLKVNMIRTVPGTAITFATYEMVVDLINKYLHRSSAYS
eukprot:TRINITY_DN1294_c0_g1::TRINITY_DN1294_c0_g1_i1::g.26925::m.26925 TRINITY_DN1294_c0_g1::TRINITY_DN1294_c0_g1_i1::g.26925  ORF type:complete len:339 (-),score=16.26,sp/Q922G0/S2536_MOUSE/36.00/1e-58,Mito_carr/PF00153.22/4.4e-21,Mito_carr/PF00153.22/4.8e-19,Mito_carr/PF00153.22/3.9e-20 TRINITY_DN1294_c0_g1_i1:98-1042(-)